MEERETKNTRTGRRPQKCLSSHPKPQPGRTQCKIETGVTEVLNPLKEFENEESKKGTLYFCKYQEEGLHNTLNLLTIYRSISIFI